MNKDYYDILGVSRDANKDDIKRAFKKMAVKWHPDRFAGKSDAEKQKAEEKFKEINEANEVLSDDEKRAHYDRFGTMENFGQGGMPGGFEDMFGDMFGHFFGGGASQHFSHQPQQGQSIKIQVQVGIEDLFKGAEKTFKYKRKVRCKHCHGDGGTGVKTCPVCHGTGMHTTVQQTAFGIIQNSHPCEHCHGTGKTVEHVCEHCDGTGFETVEEEIKIQIPVGVANGNLTQISGKGNEAKSRSAVNGNLIIQYVYAFDMDKYMIDKYNNVYEIIDVMYYDCILGGEFKHTLPTGQVVTYTIPKLSSDTDKVTLKHKGIRNGDYVLCINTIMPATINSDEEKLLRDIKKLHE